MYGASFRSSDGFIIFVVGAAVFTDMMLYGLIVPMLPYVLVDRVGISPEDIQKWNSILLGVFGGALMFGSLVFGWIGDRVNTRQTPFLLGLIALGLSTLAIAITRQLPILLAARIFQGLSSAVVASVGYAILFDVVGSEKIGQALGYISMGQSVGLMVGPAIGGPLYEYGGYFVTFIPAFVLIAVEIMLRSLVVIPPTKRKGQPLTNEVENPNAALLSNEDAANPSYGTSPQVDQKDASPEGDSQNLTTTTLHPSNSTKLTLFFTSPRILTALAVLFALNTVLTLYDAIIPVYVRATFAFTAANASALFLIMVSAFLLSPLAGHIVDRHGTAFPATIGMLLLCAPVFGMSFINTNTANPFFAIAGLQFAIGFAAAICLPALMAEGRGGVGVWGY
ncbi:MAG: hypothetical protein L6R37_004109 [Teloschistes peruensis]|nr:MAG: hypothetical protein L6R37_004109 [Teloschistes peruensis]